MPTILIALLASLAILVELHALLLGFGWALIHGGGVSSVLAFVPAAIALGMLWGGYVFIRSKELDRERLVFASYAVCLLIAIEIVMPGTPLKGLMAQRMIDAVEIRNIRDEPVISDAGYPMGIRITFEAVFPRTGEYLISPSVTMPVIQGLPHHMQFGGSFMPKIVPAPEGPGPFGVFRRDIVYTVSVDQKPNFVSEDYQTGVLCLNLRPTPGMSDAEFTAALSRSRALKYRTEIHAVDRDSGAQQRGKDYVTREYDVEAIYRGLVAAGTPPCK